MSNILIVHGADVRQVVAHIIQQLRENEFDCLTYQERLKLARRGSPVITELERMVETANVVLVFVSQGLLTDSKAAYLIDLAATQLNLFTVFLPGVTTHGMPQSFYQASTSLTLMPGSPALQNQLMALL